MRKTKSNRTNFPGTHVSENMTNLLKYWLMTSINHDILIKFS